MGGSDCSVGADRSGMRTTGRTVSPTCIGSSMSDIVGLFGQDSVEVMCTSAETPSEDDSVSETTRVGALLLDAKCKATL